jgi:hypothetical protein
MCGQEMVSKEFYDTSFNYPRIIAVGGPIEPFAHHFKLQALPPLCCERVFIIQTGHMLLTQAMKGIYIQQYSCQ